MRKLPFNFIGHREFRFINLIRWTGPSKSRRHISKKIKLGFNKFIIDFFIEFYSKLTIKRWNWKTLGWNGKVEVGIRFPQNFQYVAIIKNRENEKWTNYIIQKKVGLRPI